MSIWDVNPLSKNFAGTTTPWIFGDNEDNLKMQGRLSNVITFSDTAVEYSINSHGFRCVEFDVEDFSLAAGCSVTFGLGLPDSKIWFNKIDQNFLNIGICGANVESIINAILFSIHNSKHLPKSVYTLFPHVMRAELVYYENGVHSFSFLPRSTNVETPPLQLAINNFRKNFNHHQRAYECNFKILLLKHYLEAKGIKFVYGFWDRGEIKMTTLCIKRCQMSYN